ncbi:MAG: P-II family nitrogen regulator [Lachnospiraceae bacterium]|nr:P-II family nitrogen regulator [Lachnospiraceae bacterium]
MKLMIAITPRNKGEHITQAAKKAGCGGATIILGKGTAKNQILELLGLGTSEKDLVYILAKNEEYEKIATAIKEEAQSEKKGFGIIFTIDSDRMLKNGQVEIEEEGENKMATHTLITAILNSGLAEDAMAAARKAGASGGTIINARGTGKEEDVGFFGIQIVPEKEMLIILAEKSQETAILEAIRTLPCLQEKGTGITFCSDVNNFTTLGSN